MKKVLLINALLVGLFQVSCSDEDNNDSEQNNAPNEAVLSIFAESGLSVDLTWDQVTDVDGDVVTYDLYANDEIVEENLTTVDYTWTAEEKVGITYPIIFKVISKDPNGGESVSNEVELDDPIIGEWIEILVADRLDDGSFGELQDSSSIGECMNQSLLIFTSEGDFANEFADIDDEGDCFLVNVTGSWEKDSEAQNYIFEFISDGETVFNEIIFTFEENTLSYESSDSLFVYERQ